MAVSPELLSKSVPTTLTEGTDCRTFPGCQPKIEEIVEIDGFPVGITQTPGQPIVRPSATGTLFEITAPAYQGYFLNYLGAKGLPVEATIAAEDRFSDSDYIVIDCHVGGGFSHHHVLIGYKSWEAAKEDLEILCPVMFAPGSRCSSVRMTADALKDWLESDRLRLPAQCPKPDYTEVVLPIGKVSSPQFDISTTPYGRRVSVVIGRGISGWNEKWQELATLITHLEERDELIIAICSPGGNTQTAFTFISFMEICKARVITVAIGHCASAAPVIWAAGKERYLTEAAGMMLHGILISGGEQLPTQKFTELGNFCQEVTVGMLRNTVGAIGLVNEEEIHDTVVKNLELFFTAKEVSEKTGAQIITHDLSTILNGGVLG